MYLKQSEGIALLRYIVIMRFKGTVRWVGGARLQMNMFGRKRPWNFQG